MKVLAWSLLLVAAAHAGGRGAAASPAKVSRGLIVGNAISLGLLYLGNVGTAAVSALVASSVPTQNPSSLNGLFIPIAGPFVALADPRNHAPLSVVALVFDAVAYLASVTVLTIAIVIASSGVMPSAWLSPGVAGSAAGGTFTLRLP